MKKLLKWLLFIILAPVLLIIGIIVADKLSYIHSPQEMVNWVKGECFEYNDGILDCRHYDSCDPEIKNRNNWQLYQNENLGISFSYPPGTKISVSGDTITISNIRLEPMAALADKVKLTRYIFSADQLRQHIQNLKKQVTQEWWKSGHTTKEDAWEYGSYHYSPSAYSGYWNYIVMLKAPMLSEMDKGYTNNDAFLKKLEEKYNSQKIIVWEITGSDTIPKEWGSVAGYCIDWSTPVRQMLYSIRW